MKIQMTILSLFASSSVFAATINLINGGYVTDKEGNVITCTGGSASQSKCICIQNASGYNELNLLNGNSQITLVKNMYQNDCIYALTARPECK